MEVPEYYTYNATSDVITENDRAQLLIFRGPEVILYSLMLTAGALMSLMSLYLDQKLNWGNIGLSVLAGHFVISVGLYARTRSKMERLAAYLIAVGIFFNVANLLGVITMMQFPLSANTIDLYLTRIDESLGYHWIDALALLTATPSLTKILLLNYLSSHWQLIIVMAFLAFDRRFQDLHRFVFVGNISLSFTFLVGWIAPSFGPSAFEVIPAYIRDSELFLGTELAAAELRGYALQGIDAIDFSKVIGTVAFPSYHTVMACMVAWFTFRSRLFVPAAVLSLAMIPATLTHGGHHLIDVVGGIVVFGGALVTSALLASDRPVRKLQQQQPLPHTMTDFQQCR